MASQACDMQNQQLRSYKENCLHFVFGNAEIFCRLSQEEASATSNDYCEKCMRESKGACPNPNCLSKGTNDSQLVPMDFLRVSLQRGTPLHLLALTCCHQALPMSIFNASSIALLLTIVSALFNAVDQKLKLCTAQTGMLVLLHSI